MPSVPFQKPALNLAAQLALLQQRGMIIADPARAEHYLRFIGYYRLSGYWFPFQYRDGSRAHDDFRLGGWNVQELRQFDGELLEVGPLTAARRLPAPDEAFNIHVPTTWFQSSRIMPIMLGMARLRCALPRDERKVHHGLRPERSCFRQSEPNAVCL